MGLSDPGLRPAVGPGGVVGAGVLASLEGDRDRSRVSPPSRLARRASPRGPPRPAAGIASVRRGEENARLGEEKGGSGCECHTQTGGLQSYRDAG